MVLSEKTLQLKQTFPVGKIASAVGVKEHTIRFWSKNFNHIKCGYGKNGRRLFLKESIEQFKAIRYLMHNCGMNIAGVNLFLKQNKGILKTDKLNISTIEQYNKNEEEVNNEDNNLDLFSPNIEADVTKPEDRLQLNKTHLLLKLEQLEKLINEF